MPLPESSTPQPEDLNPLTDVLYLEEGTVKRITPKHNLNAKGLLLATNTALQMLGDAMYGPGKYDLKHQPAWIDCLISDVANELNISVETLTLLLQDIRTRDHCVMYFNTTGYSTWAAKETLDQLHPFLDGGLEQIKKYHENPSAAQPFPREDRSERPQGNG